MKHPTPNTGSRSIHVKIFDTGTFSYRLARVPTTILATHNAFFLTSRDL
jgi:hypothetical protein